MRPDLTANFGSESDFPAHIWRPLVEHRAPVRCSAGFMIYLQGTQATCFYYLKEGRVKSYIQSEAGGERVLSVFEAGSLFGEASFLDELPRVSSAVALTSCQIIPIDRELVAQEIEKDPSLALAMMKYLARKVRLLSGQVDQMAFHPAKWRVAKYLLTLAESGSSIPCTQDDIADSVSVSRVTVSRILNEFSRSRLVELRYRHIQLLDRTGLEQICAD